MKKAPGVEKAGLLLVVLLLFACEAMPEEIPSDLSKQVFFNESQEYMDALNWGAALFYLEEFKRRFPNDRADIVAADYQIALMAYKQEQYDLALERFEAILKVYENDTSGELHEWVKILSMKLIDTVREIQPDPITDPETPPAQP